MSSYLLAIDNGTTSTRAIVFDKNAKKLSQAQRETTQVFPQPGWVEQDAQEVWANTQTVIIEALKSAELTASDIAAVGIATQRETVICWNRQTGEVLANAVVWQDTRTQDWIDTNLTSAQRERVTQLTGLPVTSYFSATKMRWLLDNVPQVSDAASAGVVAFGTPDSWLAWNLTGGTSGGQHITDVTNASRTLLMDIHTLQWSDELCTLFGIDIASLPRITPSVTELGTCVEPLSGVLLGCLLGDQQAACFGQIAISPGTAKSTYGTGNFLMLNTGSDLVRSHNGLITTVAYQIEGNPVNYALEGSVAVSGSLIQWLRDNLQIISEASEVEALAGTVDDNGGVYFVPAFSGLFAPYWRPDARGAIVGLTRFATKAHIARAALEAAAFQCADVISAALNDSNIALTELRVDGGMVSNEMLMQFQADLLGIPVVRPVVTETTALGAAFGAGLAAGIWTDTTEISSLWREDRRWKPQMDDSQRETVLAQWHKAVTKSFDWVVP